MFSRACLKSCTPLRLFQTLSIVKFKSTTAKMSLQCFEIESPKKNTLKILPDVLEDAELDLDKFKELFGKFTAFHVWEERITRNIARQTNPEHPFHNDPYQLKEIKIQSLTKFTPNRLGFLHINATVENSKGKKYGFPGAVFLRGGASGMLIILQPYDENGNDFGEKLVIMTIQPRVAIGGLEFMEIPAGMVDEENNFVGTAAKELREEVGMILNESELFNLTEWAIPESEPSNEVFPRAMYPSVGGCDEGLQLFVHQRRISNDTLKRYEGKMTGLLEEGENIHLKLVPYKDLWKSGARDAKALGAYALYEELKKSKTLPWTTE
ncbi:hypothetical protein B0J14DRAFT_588359 [Halenospora varia]|nr:hypothetical protein B0J14DRAFT_588359 [Halenospora varia]